MKLTAESLYYSTHLHSICFIGFPSGLQRPDIKGLGDCGGGNKTFIWMFYSYRKGQQTCSFPTTLRFVVTHSYTYLQGCPRGKGCSKALAYTYKYVTKLRSGPIFTMPCVLAWVRMTPQLSVWDRIMKMKWNEKPNENVCQPDTWYSDYKLHSHWSDSHWG